MSRYFTSNSSTFSNGSTRTTQTQPHHHHHQNVRGTSNTAIRKLSYDTANTTTSSNSNSNNNNSNKISSHFQNTSSSGSANAAPPGSGSATSNSSYIVKMSSSSSSGSSSPIYHTNNNPQQQQQHNMKMNNSHLLDHGYGATTTPDMQNFTGKFTSTSRNSEPHITDYYKQVKRPHHISDSNSASSPVPSKQAKHSNNQQSPHISSHHNASTQNSSLHQQKKHQLPIHHPATKQHSITPSASTPTVHLNVTKNCSSSSKKRTPEGNRADTSLGILTKKFVDLLQKSQDGVVDLNDASDKLAVAKRRIYDITNVLEGIGILEKKSKNNIQWKYGNSLVTAETTRQMQFESDRLEQKENNLDYLIGQLRDKLSSEIDRNDSQAYVTNNDLRNVDIFKDQVIIVIKAPPAAKLNLPDPNAPREIHIKAENNGEINAFICTESSPENSPTFSNDPLFNDINRLSPIMQSNRKSRLGLQTTYPIRSAQRNLSKSIEDAAAMSSSGSGTVGGGVIDVESLTLVSYGGLSTFKQECPDDSSPSSSPEYSLFPTTTKPVLSQNDVDSMMGGGGRPGKSSRRTHEFFVKQSNNSHSEHDAITSVPATVMDVIGSGGGGNVGNNNHMVVSNTSSTSPAQSSDSGDSNNTLSSCNNKSGLKHDVAMVNCAMVSGVVSSSSSSIAIDQHNRQQHHNHQHHAHHHHIEDDDLTASLIKKGVRNALISDSVNLSPSLLANVDQYFDDIAFLPIEPPLDYNFSLDQTEGLTDLFDEFV